MKLRYRFSILIYHLCALQCGLWMIKTRFPYKMKKEWIKWHLRNLIADQKCIYSECTSEFGLELTIQSLTFIFIACDSGMPRDQKSAIGFDVKNDSNFHAIYTKCLKWNSGKILGWVHDSICNKRFWSMRNASMMPIYGNDSDMNNRFLDDTHSHNAWTI